VIGEKIDEFGPHLGGLLLIWLEMRAEQWAGWRRRRHEGEFPLSRFPSNAPLPPPLPTSDKAR